MDMLIEQNRGRDMVVLGTTDILPATTLSIQLTSNLHRPGIDTVLPQHA